MHLVETILHILYFEFEFSPGLARHSRDAGQELQLPVGCAVTRVSNQYNHSGFPFQYSIE